MNRQLQWRLLGIIGLTIACLWLIWPPFSIKDHDGKVIQKGKINLGLDLQGGMHIVLRVDTAKVPLETRKDAIDRAIEIIVAKRHTDSQKILKEFKDDKTLIQVLNGRYGAYICANKENYKIPKGKDPKALTLEDCKLIISETQPSKSKSKKKK